MQQIVISNADDFVTFNDNFINGTFNPVWSIEVPELLDFIILHRTLLKMKLIASNGSTEPSPNARLLLTGIRPGEPQSRAIGQPFYYRRWRNADEADQQDDQRNQGLRLAVPGQGNPPGRRFPQLTVIRLELETVSGSSFTPDEDNSFFELDVIQEQHGVVSR